MFLAVFRACKTWPAPLQAFRSANIPRDAVLAIETVALVVSSKGCPCSGVAVNRCYNKGCSGIWSVRVLSHSVSGACLKYAGNLAAAISAATHLAADSGSSVKAAQSATIAVSRTGLHFSVEGLELCF